MLNLLEFIAFSLLGGLIFHCIGRLSVEAYDKYNQLKVDRHWRKIKELENVKKTQLAGFIFRKTRSIINKEGRK